LQGTGDKLQELPPHEDLYLSLKTALD